MSTSGTGVVLCRLASFLLFVQSIENLGYLLPPISGASGGPSGLAAAGAVAIFAPATAAVLIWVFAERICQLRHTDKEPSPDSESSREVLISVGMLLIGLYALLFGIVGAARVEVGYWVQDVLQANAHFTESDAWYYRLPNRLPYVVQITLGLALVLGRDRLAKILVGIRYAGTGAS